MGPHLRRLPPVSSHQHPRIPIRSRRMDLRAFWPACSSGVSWWCTSFRACPGVPMRRAGRGARHDGGDGIHRARPGLRREPAPHGREAAFRNLSATPAIASRCGLSERETEIMTLFAKGRNLAYIKTSCMCLSKRGTVSTHRQHIYQLGVHSKERDDRPDPEERRSRRQRRGGPDASGT